MKVAGKNKTPFAKKSFGQNFLVDGNYVEKIINSLNLKSDETIIEIGAGRGALTRKLVERAGKAIAIELDQDLIPILKSEFEDAANFVLVENDVLKVDFAELFEESGIKVKLVANLPYYISTAVLQRLIEQRDVFSELVLMLQREVVDRITAKAGNSERGFLSVLVEAYCETEKLFDVPPQAFRPIPKVWSSVVKLKLKGSRLITPNVQEEELFWEIVSAGFRQKRKTIFNNLKNAPQYLRDKLAKNKTLENVLESAAIEKNRRAESLTLEEWLNLFEAI